ncbi:glycogen-binding subunit 76A-like [Oppia nitens]|uniref:glycogen-binding subunit 76A-like n=1 Tax=Oppia nitens TaxID=1686743 RepID=UPI0023D9E039|nr:glycogen-binding subunit 76A-like [Oppia nitens]
MSLYPKVFNFNHSFERNINSDNYLTGKCNNRAYNYQLLICGAEHESATAWLAAATAANSSLSNKKVEQQPHLVKRFNNNDRIRRTSILRQSHSVISDELVSPTSPTSPTEKKNVRFADSIGGQLESVKYYVISPQVRRRHSTMAAPNIYSQFYNENHQKCSLVPTNYTNPSLRPDFISRVMSQSVVLHSVTTAETTVYGIISVANHTFVKKVFVKYTYNDWQTHVEVEANYMLGSHDGQSDKFSFAIYAKPNNFTQSSPDLFHPRLYFAIRYQTGDGREFWDNNDRKNYCLNFMASDFIYNLNTKSANIQFL